LWSSRWAKKLRHTCLKYFANPKIGPQRVNKTYNHDREVHVCGYEVDGVKSKDQGAPWFSLSLLIILGMAKLFIFAWTFMCPFFYMPSCALIFFEYVTHAFIEENFGERLHEV